MWSSAGSWRSGSGAPPPGLATSTSSPFARSVNQALANSSISKPGRVLPASRQSLPTTSSTLGAPSAAVSVKEQSRAIKAERQRCMEDFA